MAKPGPLAVEILNALVRHENATRDQVRRFIAEGVRPHLSASLFDRYELDPAGNLVALKGGHRVDLPPLTLLAYGMDFPPSDMVDPHEPRMVDGAPHGQEGPCIWGRGNCEHRGALAALLASARIFLEEHPGLRRPLALIVCVAGEEGSHEAARALFEEAPLPLGPTLIVRNTRNQVCLGNKGGLTVEVTVHGRPGHASDPARARNAIEGALRAVEFARAEAAAAPADPHLGGAALVPTFIESTPRAHSGIPHGCRLTLVRRLLPGEEPEAVAMDWMERWSTLDGFRFEAAISGFQHAAKVNGKGELAQALLRALPEVGGRAETCYMGAALDAGYFVRRGVEAVSFGPGDASLAHTAHDMVSIAELQGAARTYHRLMELMLLEGRSPGG
ncbi:MAG TPA: M20/M25/M40 family metallo-hydrolase [Candidatus Sulfotelmatobacter sp.]|nr:M20/M25/M40 family metallo-hydrolase [Candidatus Sulfotelmatobacter sp.]